MSWVTCTQLMPACSAPSRSPDDSPTAGAGVTGCLYDPEVVANRPAQENPPIRITADPASGGFSIHTGWFGVGSAAPCGIIYIPLTPANR